MLAASSSAFSRARRERIRLGSRVNRALCRCELLFEQKVETRINIRTILQKSPEAAKHMVTEARKVLESWHAIYMDVRHRIEESGTDHRWEFDRKRLFEQTNYMARVCGDLLEVIIASSRALID